jgi:hypothetical protein
LKKIDLHIHTIKTVSDSAFDFSLDAFRGYVLAARLDAIAVTNHNMFSAAQFREIENALSIVAFPGIEIDVGNGHLLLISDSSDLDAFEAKATQVTGRIKKAGDSISLTEMESIYGDLTRYLLIPHTDKSPYMETQTLTTLMKYSSAGEVDSAKKFFRAKKDPSKPTPVLFSDVRISDSLTNFPSRQTYVDCGPITIASLKECLRDKTKVALSEKDGNMLWQVFPNGQMLSSGLNVIIGGRSTGKTHTLNAISNIVDDAKYIKQFSLVQQDEEAYEREFNASVARQRSALVDNHLLGLKRVIDNVMTIDLKTNDKAVQQYVDTLLRAAEEVGRRDSFSKATLFDESEFSIGNTDNLKQLIDSVRHVIENEHFRSVIEKHLDLNALRRLALELIDLFRAVTLETQKKTAANSVIKEVKQALRIRTSAVQTADVDLYQVCMDDKRVQRFVEIVDFVKHERVILAEPLQDFRIEARRERFNGAMEIKRASNKSLSFSDAFGKYSQPYEYLRRLLEMDGLPKADLYRLFVKITYRILNRDGHEVSGGERSEVRLLQEIADAQNFEILLIDEPESSFDNLFLKSDVNKLIKALSETMPVIVVTHNNTVGASIGADFVLHTVKVSGDGPPKYRLYCGYPGDTVLTSVDGHTVRSHDVVMDSLEGGISAYEGRRISYEAIKD